MKRNFLLLCFFIASVTISTSYAQNHFITTWNTGSDTTIVLPIFGGSYDVDTDNDGSFEFKGFPGTRTQEIDFLSSGEYTIAIRPNANNTTGLRINFNAITSGRVSESKKLLSIKNWGDIVWTSMQDAFKDCRNMTIADNAGAPNLTQVTDMSNTFNGATSFNSDLSTWDVSNVTDMSNTFDGTTSFTSENYDVLLAGWSQLSLQSGVTFGAPAVNYCAGKEGRDILVNNFQWTIAGDTFSCPFITTWNTEAGDSGSTTIKLPIVSGAYDVDINNDGDFNDTDEANRTGTITIDFTTAGEHTIAIRPNPTK